ncbi:hypothetical protein TRVA0_003S01904 [Trichomonascus vanleenenianus]|uniref:RNA methyltransferase n=1 Tax=Trichomonascus vanleenenianus TaxID=2268995 RepID=UPI003ECB6A1C
MGQKKKLAVPRELRKFYNRRYSLFSLYDEGIQLNEKQWYSVTAESVAQKTARQLKLRFPKAKVVIDPFGGAGGNTIQLALMFDRVIYNELDMETCEHAMNNAQVYEVDQTIEFHHEDFFRLTKESLGVEGYSDEEIVLFCSPPWGGQSYKREVWDLNCEEEGGEKLPINKLMTKAAELAANFCLFLPKSSDLTQIVALLPKGQKADVDYMTCSGRVNGMCVYFGRDMVHNSYSI